MNRELVKWHVQLVKTSTQEELLGCYGATWKYGWLSGMQSGGSLPSRSQTDRNGRSNEFQSVMASVQVSKLRAT